MSLDRPRLDALVEYFGRGPAAEMIVKASGTLEDHMRSLRAAGQPQTARGLGHKIKGLAVMYGLSAVAAAALAIESDPGGGSPERIAELERLVAEASQNLAAYVREL